MTKAASIVALFLLVSSASQDPSGTPAERLQERTTPEVTNRLQQAIDAAAVVGTYFASPTGVDNDTCSQATPCTAQGAFMRCHMDNPQGDVCNVQLADGDYFDPGINVFYYRFVRFVGNCSNPSSVRLIGLRAGNLIWVQDHSIGIVECMRLEGFVGGVNGIAGRQHVIIDYNNVVFGNMPGGKHIELFEYSIASCVGRVLIAGNAAVHGNVHKSSTLNMFCEVNLNGVFDIDYVVNTSAWSTIEARFAAFTGSYYVRGTACNSDGFVIVYRARQAFPGSNPGNC